MTLENGRQLQTSPTDYDEELEEQVELRALSGSSRRTRFHVNRVDSMEGRASLLGDEARKSLRNMTREALPRMDNYRNILSIQAVHRPSLDELHNPTLDNKVYGLFICMFFMI